VVDSHVLLEDAVAGHVNQAAVWRKDDHGDSAIVEIFGENDGGVLEGDGALAKTPFDLTGAEENLAVLGHADLVWADVNFVPFGLARGGEKDISFANGDHKPNDARLVLRGHRFGNLLAAVIDLRLHCRGTTGEETGNQSQDGESFGHRCLNVVV